mgnify:CR=1 FL=1
MVSKNKKLSPLEKNILYNFLLIRTVQLEMIRRYHPSDKMRCPMHFCTGQEIMPSAISPYMKKNDSIPRAFTFLMMSLLYCLSFK